MISKTADFTTNLFIDGNSLKTAEEHRESDRTRGARMRDFLSLLVIGLVVSGCAAAYAPTPLPVTHPANPAAPEAPPPPPSQAFTGERIPPAPAKETPVQESPAEHGAMQGMHGGH